MRGSATQAMKRTVHRLKGLVEEAKRRTILWAIFIAGFAYLLSLTSSSVWLNVPVAAAFLILIRYLSFELEIRRKVHISSIPSHLSHLLKNQLSCDDLLLSSTTSIHWRRKIDSPIIEEALDGFTRRIVQEFVTNSWYSALSPDQDVPEQIRLLVIDIFGELGQRVKRINLINLVTRDIVELVGGHLELFRQARYSIRRFESLSSEDREKELKLALSKGNQLHPALSSPDSECKVLQKLMGGMVAIVLRPQDAQCVLMKGLARELLACAVLRPVMNLANPGFINKSIERAIISARAKSAVKNSGSVAASGLSNPVSSRGSIRSSAVAYGSDGSAHGRREDWGQTPDTVSERKSRSLAGENLDNLLAKGQDYKKRDFEKASVKQSPGTASARVNDLASKLEKQDMRPAVKDVFVKRGTSKSNQAGESTRAIAIQSPTTSRDVKRALEVSKGNKRHDNIVNNQRIEASNYTGEVVTSSPASSSLPGTTQGYLEKPVDEIQGTGMRHRCTHSSTNGPENWQKPEPANTSNNISTLDYWDTPGMQASLGGNNLDPVTGWLNEPAGTVGQSGEVQSASKLNCWVVGAHLEKAASKTFAVYSIAVTDTDNNTWFVERRFRNFEQLHRKLRDLPQYNLQLPPKRFLSSSLDETFVHDRCILLDKYLKDLLSIPSIAELHEVWDFLSITSKNYAHSKSPSVMKTLAVNVDDAVDDMFRQLRGVSDGLLRRVGGPPSDADEASHFMLGDGQKQTMAPEAPSGSFLIDNDKTDFYSDEEFIGPGSTIGDATYSVDNWPFDNDLHDATVNGVLSQRLLGNDKNAQLLEKRMERGGSDAFSIDESTTGSETYEEDLAVPPEWTPPKLTEPLLNLVENIFQLQDRGWIRRQGFWIAKQILQLGMGDAVDDWLVTQIQQLRQEDVVAGSIKSLQEILWPGGVFITKVQKGDNLGASAAGSTHKVVKLASQKSMDQSASFEAQLEAARCAKAVHDCLLEGAPQPLVSFVGKQQYTKSAKDIYYFLQSSVFLKQLVFSILETLLITVFPEMTRLVLDIRYQGV
ncbi:hypothetical protein GOP47_0005034 [Adiantum capillus-veneris]|uniref:Uncharacterized protein n=1 Tax=Adiantum capillus-veneris TaxID=13818 RepID=A0A9D4ZNS7_ADICA|nr:hypothetical protein GOP47_0005034 [Adiantum capillus-veneris]